MCIPSVALTCFRFRLNLQETNAIVKVIKREFTKGRTTEEGGTDANLVVEESNAAFQRCIEIVQVTQCGCLAIYWYKMCIHK